MWNWGKNMKYENVFTLLEEITIQYGEKVSLGMKSKWGWNEFTYKGLGLLSRRLASYIINDLQVEKGENLQFYQNPNRNTEHVFLAQF